MSKLIVIDRGLQFIRLVECEVRGSRIFVRGLKTIAVPDLPEGSETDATQSIVVRELAGYAGSKAQVVGLIARSHAVLRDLRLPDAPADEMPGIVQLQAMRELSFPVEQAAIDYEIVGPPDKDGQRRVILAALQQESIDRLQHAVTASQLVLSRVGLRPYATWRAYRAVSVMPNAAVLVVAVAGESLELTIGQGESVLFSRATLLRPAAEGKGETADPSPILVGEVRRTLAAFTNQMPGAEVERVALAAGPEEHLAISTALSAAGLTVDRFDPFQAVELARDVKQSLDVSGERGALVAAIGAAVSLHEPWPIDFLNPKKPVVRRDRRKPIALMAAAAVVLLVATSYALVQVQLSSGRKRIQQLAEQNSHLKQQLEGATEIIRKKQAVELWQSTGVQALDLLAELTGEHPETREMYLTSLRMERDRGQGGGTKLMLDGVARQQLTSSEFNTKLNEGETFTAQPDGPIQTDKRNGDFPWSFKSVLTFKAESGDEESAVPGGSATKETGSPRRKTAPSDSRRITELPEKGSARRTK